MSSKKPIGPKQPRVDLPVIRDRSHSPNIKSLASSCRDDLFLSKVMFCSQPLSKNAYSEVDRQDRRRYSQEILSMMNQKESVEKFISPNLPAIFRVIEGTLFRPLQKLTSVGCENETLDQSEKEQLTDPTWPLVSPVYTLFQRILECSFISQKDVKHLIGDLFIQRFLELFDSEYSPEKSILRSLLHLLYLKQIGLRKSIRKAMNELFYTLIHVEYKFNGASEILEIQGSIISGFAVPIKEEHLSFFRTVVLPLHKLPTCQLFHEDLMRCTVLFVNKDHMLGLEVIDYLVKVWPHTNSNKQIKFLEEMMIITGIVPCEDLNTHIKKMAKKVAVLLGSSHFKACDFAISCFEKKDFLSLIESYKSLVFPIVIPVLSKAKDECWQPTIRESLFGLSRLLEEIDCKLYMESDRRGPTEESNMLGSKAERSPKERVWEKLKIKAERLIKDIDLKPPPYKDDHVIGNFNGLDNTNMIIPEIM